MYNIKDGCPLEIGGQIIILTTSVAIGTLYKLV